MDGVCALAGGVVHSSRRLWHGPGLRRADRGGSGFPSLAPFLDCGQTQVNTDLNAMPQTERQTVVAKSAAKAPVVFVLEDDPDILRLIQHHLKAANFETVGYPTSSGMLEQAVRLQPALFLLDIMLPGESGLDV